MPWETANEPGRKLVRGGLVCLLTIVLLTVGRFHLYRMMHLRWKRSITMAHIEGIQEYTSGFKGTPKLKPKEFSWTHVCFMIFPPQNTRTGRMLSQEGKILLAERQLLPAELLWNVAVTSISEAVALCPNWFSGCIWHVSARSTCQNPHNPTN